jgi:hypothetical protein
MEEVKTRSSSKIKLYVIGRQTAHRLYRFFKKKMNAEDHYK